MFDGVVDYVIVIYCSVKCVMFYFVGYFIVYRLIYLIFDFSLL